MGMQLLRIFAVLAATCQAAISQAAAGGIIGSIHVGPWTGGAFTEKAGEFGFCAATTPVESGYVLTIGQNADRFWVMAITHPDWGLKRSQKLSLDLTFDGQSPINFSAAAKKHDHAIGLLSEAAAERFRHARSMTVSGTVQAGPLTLQDADKLMSVISFCVDRVKAGGLAAADVDFVALSKNAPASAPAEKSSPTEKPNAAPPRAGSGAEKVNVTPAERPAPAERPGPAREFDASGSGFVVSPSGHVVTNYHVIGQCIGEIHGNLTGERPALLRVVSADEHNDLALLQASGTFKQPATIRNGPVHSGDGVVAIGYPFHGLLTSDFTVTSGIVSSLSGILNDTRFLQISAPVQPGNSGGPLHDTSGLVVGVVSEKLDALKFASVTGNIPENISFAIKQGALRDFLDNSAVPYKTANAQTERKTAEITSAARSYTMLIYCRAKEKESEKAKR
jgi:S1-C subfamily serine protease